ncbi:MAG: pentapeptide repeat-containing protein [Alphaproteobacteria bacterium]
MRLLLFCLMFCAALLFVPTQSKACWCPPQPEDKFYKEAAVVFTAKVIERVDGKDRGSKKMLARVDKVYKGKPTEEVYLRSATETDCGSNLKEGIKYLVYAGQLDKDTYNVSHCTGTYPLRDNDPRIKADIAVMEDRRRQIDALGDAIAQNPQQERLLLKTMAEHEVYWQDHANAEDSLRRLIQLQPDDSWTRIQLFHALFGQKKAQEIWDLYESSKKEIKGMPREEIMVAVSFAAFELGKDLGEFFGYSLKGTRLADKDLRKRKFRSLSVQDSPWENVDFSDARFEYVTWRKSIVQKSNFSRVAVKNGYFDDSNLWEVNFSGAHFESMTAKDTRFKYSDFAGANLNGAQISGSDFYHAGLAGAELRNAKIKDTSFKKADISGVDFTGAILEGVDWTDVIYDCKTIGAPLPPKVCPSAP